MKLLKYQKSALRKAVKTLLNDPTSRVNPRLGICWHLDKLVEQGATFVNAYSVVAHYSVDWPERAGELCPSSDGVVSCHWPIPREYDADACHLPLWQGNQLAQRISLLKYLLTRLA